MTNEGMAKVFQIIQATYPSFKPSDPQGMFSVWMEMLSDYSDEVVALALKAFIRTSTSDFAPTIGQIIDTINNITTEKLLNEMEAWALVSKALRNGTYNYNEEFEKLPETVRKAVGSPMNIHNWATNDYQAIETVIQSNFLRSYKQVVKQEQEMSKMPLEVKKLISSINSQLINETSNMAITDTQRGAFNE